MSKAKVDMQDIEDPAEVSEVPWEERFASMGATRMSDRDRSGRRDARSAAGSDAAT